MCVNEFGKKTSVSILPAGQWLPRSIQSLNVWCAVAIGASISVSIALDNLLLGVVVLTWIAGLHYREKLGLVWTNPVYRAELLLFGVPLMAKPRLVMRSCICRNTWIWR